MPKHLKNGRERQRPREKQREKEKDKKRAVCERKGNSTFFRFVSL